MSVDLGPLAGRVSYAQCWEDPALLTEALEVGPGDEVLSICSAGDNSFALAIAGARVTAVDLSGPQLALAELKLAAARTLSLEGFRELVGLGAASQRLVRYRQLRERIGARARGWWDAHEAEIRDGLLGSGRFERYLALFRTRVLPLVHSRRRIEQLLALDEPAEQRRFYDRHWNTLRWRALFRLFFSRFVMARSGRSVEQFRYVNGPVSEVFLARTEHVLTDLPARSNFFLQWMLTGRYRDLEAAHPYLSAEGMQRLAGADIRFVQADLESFLARCEPGRFSAFNYSDVFEYLSPEQHRRILELTVRAARPGARIAYWNLLVPRWRPDDLADRIARHPKRSAELLRRDRAFVYGGFQLETVR